MRQMQTMRQNEKTMRIGCFRDGWLGDACSGKGNGRFHALAMGWSIRIESLTHQEYLDWLKAVGEVDEALAPNKVTKSFVTIEEALEHARRVLLVMGVQWLLARPYGHDHLYWTYMPIESQFDRDEPRRVEEEKKADAAAWVVEL